MDIFVKGELVILQHATYFAEWDGALAVVVGALAPRNPMNLQTMKREPFAGYEVVPLVEGGFKVTCEPHQLRKLREPGADDRREAMRHTRTPEPVTVR